MTTITIKNSKKQFTKTNFENLADLQDYLVTIVDTEREFSKEFKTELDWREKELLSGEIKGVSWNEIKADFLDRS